MFPPLPSDWSGLHPLVIYFPVALLLVSPILVVVAMFAKNSRRPYLVSALLLMLVGTVMTYVAVSTGHAAGELSEGSGAVDATLERRDDLAETTRTVFAVLTLVFAAALVLPRYRVVTCVRAQSSRGRARARAQAFRGTSPSGRTR